MLQLSLLTPLPFFVYSCLKVVWGLWAAVTRVTAAAVAAAVGLDGDMVGLQSERDPPGRAGRDRRRALDSLESLDRKLRHGSQCAGVRGADQPIWDQPAVLQTCPKEGQSFNAGHLAEVSRCLDNPDLRCIY